jgi:hypothetical protein
MLLETSLAAPGWPDVQAHATIRAVRTNHPAGERLLGRLLSPTRRLGQAKAPAALLVRGVPGAEDCGDLAYALRDAGLHCFDLLHSGCFAPASGEAGVSLDAIHKEVAAALRFRALSPCA